MDAFSHTSRHAAVVRRARRAPRRKGRPAAFMSWRRQGRLVGLAVALALALLVLLLLGEALGVLPGDSPLGAPAARGAPLIPLDTPTTTITPTPTTPPAGTISLVSPISHEGPTNATLTITGAGWGASSVTITANIGSCPATPSTANNLTTVTPSGGSFTADPPWPASLTQPGIYTLCAYDGKNPPVSGPAYTLQVGEPAALSISPTPAQANQPVTISATNFLGVQSVTVKATTPDGAVHTIGVYQPDATGAFQAQYVPQATDTGGSITITAQSPVDPSATVPALSVTTQLTVGAANTPTPTVAPTATTAVAPSSTSNSHGPSVGVIVALVVGILLALLLIVGLVAFVIIRRNSAPGDDIERGYGRGPNGRTPPMRRGYGYDPGYSEEYAAPGGYASGARRSLGQTRGYGNDYGGDYDSRMVGGVSGWDDPEPDPNWRSRPMSGRRAALPDDSFDDLGYPSLGAPARRAADGWDDTTGAYTGQYGPEGYTDETGAYTDGYASGYTDESTSYSDQPVYGRRPQSGGPARTSGAPGPAPLSPPPGRASGASGGRPSYPDPYDPLEPKTRPAGPSSRPGYGASYPGTGYPPAPLVPPGAGPVSGSRSTPGRGGPTGRRNSGVRPASPDPRRSGPGAPPGWDDTDDGRGGW